MKYLSRFVMLWSVILGLSFTFLATATPVAAGCANEITLTSVTAYRNHISITFNITKGGVIPVDFTVSDGGTLVGSATFNTAGTGSFTIEFDLDSSAVKEFDTLDVSADPNLGCIQRAKVTASGMYGLSKTTPECADGRINYDDCDKIAMYPVKDETGFGLEVWIVDKKVIPEFALYISAEDLKARPDKPDAVLTVASSKNGLVTLYKHPNGDYQVNYGPDFEGKVFTFRFSGIPAVSYPEVTTFMIGVLQPRYTPEIG